MNTFVTIRGFSQSRRHESKKEKCYVTPLQQGVKTVPQFWACVTSSLRKTWSKLPGYLRLTPIQNCLDTVLHQFSMDSKDTVQQRSKWIHRIVSFKKLLFTNFWGVSLFVFVLISKYVYFGPGSFLCKKAIPNYYEPLS